MKRLLSMILCVLMISASICTFGVNAAFEGFKDGPNLDSEMAYIEFGYDVYNEKTEEYDYFSAFAFAHGNFEEDVRDIEGVKYDLATNTLTLTNFDDPNCSITANMMGAKFTIKVEGKCSIAALTSWGDGWAGDITITGNGSLEINSEKNTRSPIIIFAEATPSTLTIEDGVTVTLHAGFDWENGVYSPVIYSNYNECESTDEFLNIGGKVTPNNYECQKFEGDILEQDYVLASNKNETISLEYLVDEYGIDYNYGLLECWMGDWEEGDPPTGYYIYNIQDVEGVGKCATYIDYLTTETMNEHNISASTTTVDVVELNETCVEKYTDIRYEKEVWGYFESYGYYDSVLDDIVFNYVFNLVEFEEHDGYSFYTVDVVYDVDDPYSDDCFFQPVYTKTGTSTEFLVNGLETLTITPTSLPFEDVKTTSWYYEGVAYCYANGFMAGMDSTHFAPKDNLTRAQIVVILAAMSGEDLSIFSDQNSFSDVKSTSYYHNAVEWAVAAGITSGMGAGTFAPKAELTREQLACMMMSYAQYKSKPTNARADLSVFADASRVHSWASDAMSWAVAEGLISGTGSGLDPRGTATRAMAATIIANFDKNIIKSAHFE